MKDNLKYLCNYAIIEYFIVIHFNQIYPLAGASQEKALLKVNAGCAINLSFHNKDLKVTGHVPKALTSKLLALWKCEKFAESMQP